MPSSTVKDLFEKWESCKQEARVWEYLRDSLDQTRRMTKADNTALIRMRDGRGVDDEVMVQVVAELDGMIEEIKRQAEHIEAQQVK